METKDRIRSIMEDLKKTQQEFADFLEQSPATLSSIFNGRTRPSLNVVDAIKAKIPDISVEWLLYGTGEKYVTHPSGQDAELRASQDADGPELMLQFDAPRQQHPETVQEAIKVIEKEPRKVTEIRVYYDDQTYETFLPVKK